MPPSSASDRLLTYGDATVVRSDLSILNGPHFMNDRLIHFYLSHLSISGDPKILLVPPSISFLIANFPDPTDVIAPLRMSEKRLVLFPVNDNNDVTVAEGGSHWSLLVCNVAERVFVHHDSNGGMNRVHAVKLFKAVKGFFGGSEWRYLEGPTPQQTNGYDCGLFLLAIAKSICKWYYSKKKNENQGLNESEEKLWFGELMEEVNGNKVQELRAELRDLILELIEKNNS